MATPSKREKRMASKTAGSPSNPRRSLFQNNATKMSAQTKKKKAAAAVKHKAKSAPIETIAVPGIVVEQEEEKEAYWEVESVVGRKKSKGNVYFKIRWKGCTAEEDTWEPETNLCDSALQEALDFEAAETLQQHKKAKEKQTQKKVKEADAKQVAAKPAVTSEAAQVPGARIDEGKHEADVPAVDAAVEMLIDEAKREADVPAVDAAVEMLTDEAKCEADVPAVDSAVEMPIEEAKHEADVPAVDAAVEMLTDEAKRKADVPAVDAAVEMLIDEAKREANVPAVDAAVEMLIDEAKREADVPAVDAAVETPVFAVRPIKKVKRPEGKKVAAKSILPVTSALDSGPKNSETKLEAATSAVDSAPKTPAMSNVTQMDMSAAKPTGEMTVEK